MCTYLLAALKLQHAMKDAQLIVRENKPLFVDVCCLFENVLFDKYKYIQIFLSNYFGRPISLLYLVAWHLERQKNDEHK